jgi:hypothetical protein
MIVVIHQPHFMPWLGYLHRMAQADVFVVLDHVQFERGNYQNRSRICMESAARWLTVPVVQRSQKERIVDKEIDNRQEGPRRWGPNLYSTMRHAYREAPFFAEYGPEIKSILEHRWERLAELNRAMLDLMRAAFDIRTPLVKSSELNVDGHKGELVLNICRAVGADHFLGGMGGSRTYLDVAAFERAGVSVSYHDFQHPVYRQCGSETFIPGLAAVDLLFNCGPQSRAMLMGETTQESYCAA